MIFGLGARWMMRVRQAARHAPRCGAGPVIHITLGPEEFRMWSVRCRCGLRGRAFRQGHNREKARQAAIKWWAEPNPADGVTVDCTACERETIVGESMLGSDGSTICFECTCSECAEELDGRGEGGVCLGCLERLDEAEE